MTAGSVRTTTAHGTDHGTDHQADRGTDHEADRAGDRVTDQVVDRGATAPSHLTGRRAGARRSGALPRVSGVVAGAAVLLVLAGGLGAAHGADGGQSGASRQSGASGHGGQGAADSHAAHGGQGPSGAGSGGRGSRRTGTAGTGTAGTGSGGTGTGAAGGVGSAGGGAEVAGGVGPAGGGASWARKHGVFSPPGAFVPSDALTYDAHLVPPAARIEVAQYADRAGTGVAARLEGFVANRAYGAHVHTSPCGADPAAAGPHYQHRLSATADPENEVWLDFRTDRHGNGAAWARHGWGFREGGARSVVIHDEQGGAGERIACFTVPFGPYGTG
ncbi:superoxide dismutase family protein [Streptomyces sp. NPDC088729]|uniref:superoxide dismutase family protein n=1 Tax=Streptomyces sp. NPDC088729 TaxID=3365876 RepID=UPI00381F2CAF